MRRMNETPTMNPISMRLAGAAGITSVLLGTVAAIVARMWEIPDTRASATEVASYVAAHRSAALAAMVLNTIAVTLWLDFGACVWARLRQTPRSDGYLAACFGLGLAGFVTLIFAGFAVFFVLVYRSGDVGDARMLRDVAFGLLALSGAPTVLALSAYATLVYMGGPFPRWTAHLAALAAAAHIVLIGSFLVSSGFFSLEGEVIIAIPATLFAWIFGTGVALLKPAR
jgi:hypothetical protein